MQPSNGKLGCPPAREESAWRTGPLSVDAGSTPIHDDRLTQVDRFQPGHLSPSGHLHVWSVVRAPLGADLQTLLLVVHVVGAGTTFVLTRREGASFLLKCMISAANLISFGTLRK